MRDTVEQFLLAKEVDGRSPETIKWYRWHLDGFAKATGDLLLTEITAQTIRVFISKLRTTNYHYRAGSRVEGKLSEETITSKLRALKAFFRWCVQEGHLTPEQNPMLRIRVPGFKQQNIKAISINAWNNLFEATRDSDTGKRDRALLAFMLDSGARAGGVVGLTMDNVFVAEHYAIVQEKGDKIRPVPFTEYTAALLREWIEARPGSSDAVFCGLGSKNRGNALTTNALYQIFDRLKKKAGIIGRCNPHSLRHAFAREVASASGDIAMVSRLMGHSQIAITMNFYARFTFIEDARKYQEFSPLRNFNNPA